MEIRLSGLGCKGSNTLNLSDYLAEKKLNGTKVAVNWFESWISHLVAV